MVNYVNPRGLAVAIALLAPIVPGAAHAAGPYPAMAPVSQYLMTDRTAEIALARTAAPPSISKDAEVIVLTAHGYVSAGPGRNGFVCMVQRAWFSGVEDKGFWNPKLRAPVCLNRQGARSVLPTFLTRTQWAVAGVSQDEIRKRTVAALKSGKIPKPELGTVSYMLSKQGYLGDDAGGPWHPHVMFYMPPMKTADWGADLEGSPVMSTAAGVDPWTMFYVPVAQWSDGTPDAKGAMHHGG